MMSTSGNLSTMIPFDPELEVRNKILFFLVIAGSMVTPANVSVLDPHGKDCAYECAELPVQCMAKEAVIYSKALQRLDRLCRQSASSNPSTSHSPTLKSHMSVSIHQTGEDILLEARQPQRAHIPFTRNLNNDMTNPIISEMRIEGEHVPGMVKESTVWDVYNNEARKVDYELVKDWTASLNFLLVFAAIFAAVLTAFIIESKKMLEADQTEILVDIAIQYLNGIGNQPRNITRPDFEPTFEAISINCLLFASLGTSLVAALASVVALQWVADYDAAITRGGSSPEDRAKRRQFRYAGVVGWKMGEIIAALPILLYSSVVLFSAGSIQWMWTLNHTVGYVVAAVTTVAVLFYASTTILAAVYVSAPFRTPLSRALYWAMYPSASTIYRLISWIPFTNILRSVALLKKAARFPSSFLDNAVVQWIKKHLLPRHTSRYREDRAAEQEPSAASDALAWLAQRLPLSTDSHERLLLWVSGVTALSTGAPPSPRFYDSPWLAILEVLSERFMRQILGPLSLEKDYRGIGILLQCINSATIRSKLVPNASYIQDPTYHAYWEQYCAVNESNLDLGGIRRPPMAFLLARDVPVPSPDSKYELEATWKLIRWRNSIRLTGERPYKKLRSDGIWSEVFRDIGQYSPEFLESCLCHFRVWTSILRPVGLSGPPDYTVTFSSLVKQALYRDPTIGEAVALVRAFAGYLTQYQRYWLFETVDETNIIPRPLSYALAVGRSSESTQVTHLAITLLVVRVARSLVGKERLQWARWITFMLWVACPKKPEYLDTLQDSIEGDEMPRNVLGEIGSLSTSVAVQRPHVDEIARILWRVDNEVTGSLSRDALNDPQSLRYLELLLQMVPHCYTHLTGSQHILLHLYECVEAGSRRPLYANFQAAPIGLENVDWTGESFNPILAMLALSDNQGLPSLRLDGRVDLECAGRILEAVKAVKRRPIEFLCLISGIVDPIDRELSPANLALILEIVKQATAFVDGESVTPLLRPIMSGVKSIQQLAVGSVPFWWQRGPVTFDHIAKEARWICSILQAKYAASLISSTTQLRLLSCACSVAVAQPAMGWLRMHEPL